MVDPIRFERGGPAPRFKVQRLRDLEDVRDQIDYEIKKKVSLLDNLTDENPNQEQEETLLEENTEHLHDIEKKVMSMMQIFSEMITGCEISSEISKDDKSIIEEKLIDLKDYSESLKKITTKKFALSRAKLLIKSFWQKLRKVDTPVNEHNRENLEAYFRSGVFSKDSSSFQNAICAINSSVESTKGLTGNALYVAMIKKGELLEAKEELITAFLEYKRKMVLRYDELHRTSAITRDICPSIQKKIFAGIEELKKKPSDLTNKIIGIVTSNRYSDPTSLIKDSLSLAILETSPSNHPLATHNLSVAQATLSLGFSVPVSLLSTLQLIRNFARRRKITAALHEARNIQTIGDLMYREGQNVHKITSQMLTEKIEHEEDLEKMGLLLKQSDRLTSLGIELKEKALLAEQELKQELSTITFSIFNGVVSTPLNLAGIASTSLKVAAQFITNPAVKVGLQVVHFVGIASGGVGLVLGSIGLIQKSKTIHETRKKLAALDKKGMALTALEKEFGEDPLVKEFCAMEKTKLLNEKASLQVDLRNYWIELGNSILLTIGGALTFAAIFASAAATGGLSIAVLVIIGISTAIVIAHWAKKKDWEIEKQPIDPDKLIHLQGNLDVIGNYLNLEEEKRKRFLEKPNAILQIHFKKDK